MALCQWPMACTSAHYLEFNAFPKIDHFNGNINYAFIHKSFLFLSSDVATFFGCSFECSTFDKSYSQAIKSNFMECWFFVTNENSSIGKMGFHVRNYVKYTIKNKRRNKNDTNTCDQNTILRF